MRPFPFSKLRSSSPTDPLFAFVLSLLHYEGPNGSTTFTDQIVGTTWTATNATIDTSESKFGTSSGNFTHHSASDHIIANSSGSFNIGTSGDYCIELFVNQVGTGFDECSFDCRNPPASGYPGIAIYNCANGLGGVPAIFNASTNIITGPTQLSAASFHYLVAERWSGNLYFWIDGVLIGSVADTQDTTFSGMVYGNNIAFNVSANSWLDESRITAHARYFGASTIAVPSAPFPDS